MIVRNLEAENYNIESAIIAMLQMNQGKRNSKYMIDIYMISKFNGGFAGIHFL